MEMVLEGLANLLGLSLSEQAVVHEYACEIVAYSPVDHKGNHRRVDSAAQSAYDLFISDLGTDIRHRPFDERGHLPRGFTSAYLEDKVLQDPHAFVGMSDFGMELEGIEFSIFICHSSNRRVVGMPDYVEPFRHYLYPVAVAHPDLGLLGQPP